MKWFLTCRQAGRWEHFTTWVKYKLDHLPKLYNLAKIYTSDFAIPNKSHQLLLRSFKMQYAADSVKEKEFSTFPIFSEIEFNIDFIKLFNTVSRNVFWSDWVGITVDL